MYNIVQVPEILFVKSVNNFLPEKKPDYIVYTTLKTYVNPL